MLESSFIFLNGIGESTERRLWNHGITHWKHFLKKPNLPGISSSRKELYDKEVRYLLKQFSKGNLRPFSKRFKPEHHWRFLRAFPKKTAFLDIETNGQPIGFGEITLLGLYANGKMTTLVKGKSLTQRRLQQELSKYDLLVTFFGTVFDLPFLRSIYPQLLLDHAHFDLCFAARRLGLQGGLKNIEKRIGLARSINIEGLVGWDAVKLWYAWQAGDQKAGQTLCEYNEADVRNLEPLSQYLYERLVKRYGPNQK